MSYISPEDYFFLARFFHNTGQSKSVKSLGMKTVYYKGKPYTYSVTEIIGKRKYSLYENDVLVHFVDEEELDKRSVVSIILDSYYRQLKNTLESKQLVH